MKKFKSLLTIVIVLVLLSTFTFIGCNKKDNENNNVDEQHEYIYHEAIDATYEQDGCEEYYTCASCDKLFNSEKVEISKIPTKTVSSIFSNRKTAYKNLTNDQFANFRPLVGSEFGHQIVFRGSSPIDSFIRRNTYSDYAARTYGVNIVINLCDTKEEAQAYKNFNNTYYSKQSIKYAEMPTNIEAENYKQSIFSAIKYIADNKGIYLIHDDYGSMRTGIVSSLLEVYMGATSEDALKDFLLSYNQYFGMTSESELAPYYTGEYNKAIKFLVGDTFNKQSVVTFFKSIGLSDADLENLHNNLAEDADIVRIDNFLDLTEAFIFGKDLEITYEDSDLTSTQAKIDLIKGFIDAEEISWDELSVHFDELDEMVYNIYDQKRIVDIYAAMYADNNYYELSNTIMDAFNDVLDQYDEIEVKIADTKYRNDYYEGMTDEEIDEYVASIDLEANKAASALSSEMNEIQLKYQKSELLPEEALAQYKVKANEYAALFGYDNYFAYAYENIYNRHFSYTEGLAIEEYIKDYVVPVNQIASNKFNAALSMYQEELISYIFDFFGSNMDLIKDYAEFVGGDFETNFNNLFASGNYFISNINNPNETAFQASFADGTPFMFFGKEYQGLMTFIHEFGHYNADFKNTIKEFDLFEVQSQGDECLLAVYMLNNGYADEVGFEGLIAYQLYSLTSSIITGYLINKLENYLYTSNNIEGRALYEYWDQLCDEIGVEEYKADSYDDYWQYAAIQAPGYYMSYATSAMAALQIFAKAMVNLEDGRDAYTKVYDYPEELESFVEVLNYAGLYSPFVEDGYLSISIAIKSFFKISD